MRLHLPGRQGVGAQVIHGYAEYDVELEAAAQEFYAWLDALRGAADQFVADAGRHTRDAGKQAVQRSIDMVNESLGRLVNEVYTREVKE